MKHFALASVLAGMAAFSGGVAAETRIAVVNISKLVTESPQAATARQKMDQEFSARRKRLEGLQDKLVADVEKAKKDAAVMSADQKKKMQEDLGKRQREFGQQQGEYNAEVARREQQELEALRKTILEVVAEVARQSKYDVVLGDGVIYASDATNITDKVLAAMRGKAGKQ
ncbi:MAG: OmpH family outer membrane protein [Nevskiales bacterium]